MKKDSKKSKRRKVKCDYIKKDGSRCGKWARNGYTKCSRHGAGTVAKPGGRPIKTGLYSKVLKKKLKGKIEKYRNDPALLDLREYIATKRALLDELIKNAVKKNKKGKLNTATINNAVAILNAIAQDVERLHKMEHGTKHTISVNILEQAVSVIVAVIDKEVPDEKIKERIFGRLGQFGLTADQSSVQRN